MPSIWSSHSVTLGVTVDGGKHGKAKRRAASKRARRARRASR